MASSGMLHHVALVRTDVSEKLRASFSRVTRIGELGTTLVTASVPSSPILVVDPSSLLLWPFICLLYQPWLLDGDDCGAVSGMDE
jgi:hypothetical protein